MPRLNALILAAGMGTRLGILTQHTPKPMMKIKGTPVIGWVYKSLRDQGIIDICVNVHYKPKKIIEYLYPKGRILYLSERELLGTAGTILALRDWLSDPFLVVNGDTISNVNYREMVRIHTQEDADVTVFTLHDYLRSGGSYVFSKRVIDEIPQGKAYSINEDLLPKLKEKKAKIICYRPKRGYFFDIGTLSGLGKAEEFFNG